MLAPDLEYRLAHHHDLTWAPQVEVHEVTAPTTLSIGDATVVTLYLLPELMRRLTPKLLRELRPGTRIVAHDFALPDWPPERVVEVPLDRVRHVYLWRVPPRP